MFLKSDTRIEKSMMFDTWVVGGMWVGWDAMGCGRVCIFADFFFTIAIRMIKLNAANSVILPNL